MRNSESIQGIIEVKCWTLLENVASPYYFCILSYPYFIDLSKTKFLSPGMNHCLNSNIPCNCVLKFHVIVFCCIKSCVQQASFLHSLLSHLIPVKALIIVWNRPQMKNWPLFLPGNYKENFILCFIYKNSIVMLD